MKNIFWENIVKNIIVLFVLLFSYSPIQTFIHSSNLTSDNPVIGNLLVVVSIIAVTACFGNFAFTYEKIAVESASQRMLAHTTTGLLMLLIGISLIFTGILMAFIMGHFFVVDLALILLYTTCVTYDFWDLFRALN